MTPRACNMCTKDCYKVFGYFLGFMWIITCFYYTMETMELLKLMKLQCSERSAAMRLQFDDELVSKVCEFYSHLGNFLPYHVVTTLIKMLPGMILIIGIYTNNITLLKVFVAYAFLEEIFFIVVFSKIFTLINIEGGMSAWFFWILAFSCAKIIFGIWIILGVFAAIGDNRRTIPRYV
ncbi:uncharacterized protein LOC129775005 [Toxorhynchites rutilus septentrionalis]|uniref:uncharacterized protein LOC129775005 n=1 Tax=Toxorhynchites rutilus septentrionalis TaxID=329112 RepID=UPI00247ADC83|nr:uncharacterized protein LOC129775005 [Toxorhynchites rutilus septentrionalis]